MRLLCLELIGQYKGLSNQVFDLENSPGNVQVLIGLNGSGKSQFMELVAEIFAFLEREVRADFRVRSALGFHFRIAFLTEEESEGEIKSYLVESLPDEELRASFVRMGKSASKNNVEPPDGSTLQAYCDLRSVPLPHVVGYASGMNENLQRPFMRNALQYFDVMTVRAKRRDELSHPDIDVDMVASINRRYRKNHPDIFGSLEKLDPNNPLQTDERDTPLPASVFLDYDCTNLVVVCLGMLERDERDKLWPDISFRHPLRAAIRYDLRNAPVEEDSIRDIQQLIRALGADAVSPRVRRASDQELERYELEYLCADISIDFSNANILALLRETYHRPVNLFWKLYKLQLLGVKTWSAEVKKSLRKDSFQGHVRKPLKGKIPLAVLNVEMSDGLHLASIDDLSDGEAQLLHTLGAVRLFGDTETLFIFDEPETHLNPNWRTRYHLDFDRASQGFGSSQALISSHSPFLISSLKRDAVLHFQKMDGITSMSRPESETFGASFEVLIKRFFGLQSAISQTAIEEIRRQLADDQLNQEEKRAWVDENVGESMERVYLLKRLEP